METDGKCIHSKLAQTCTNFHKLLENEKIILTDLLQTLDHNPQTGQNSSQTLDHEPVHIHPTWVWQIPLVVKYFIQQDLRFLVTLDKEQWLKKWFPLASHESERAKEILWSASRPLEPFCKNGEESRPSVPTHTNTLSLFLSQSILFLPCQIQTYEGKQWERWNCW